MFILSRLGLFIFCSTGEIEVPAILPKKLFNERLLHFHSIDVLCEFCGRHMLAW